MATATPSKSRVQLPAQLTAVEDLLLWHDVPKSAGVLLSATALYILLEWSRVPLLTWLSNVCIFLTLGTLLWGVAARFMSRTGPEDHMPALLRTGLDEVTVRTLAEKLRVAANRGLAHVNRILSGNDLVLAGKSMAVLWVVGWVGRIITPVGLLYTVILGLFTLPKVYEMRKDEIDQAVSQARTVSAKQYEQVRSKATEVISRLTPQKGAQPAASDISSTKDE